MADSEPTHEQSPSMRHRWVPRRRHPADYGLIAVVTISTAIYLVLARSLWFFGDDWDFLLKRGTVPGADLGLWEPHNEHWSTGPILVFRGLFAVFGLHRYLPYAVPVLVAHAAVVVLTYLLLVRFGVRRWAALAAVTVVAFNGAGAENTLWDFQIGFVGSVALGLGALWFFHRFETDQWRLWPTWAALVAALMFSSIGLVMVVLVSAYAWCRRGFRVAVLVASMPATCYLVWFLLVGRHGFGVGPSTPLRTSLLQLPSYIWTGLTHSWGAVSGIPGSGAAILLALLVTLLLRAPSRARHLAWAGTLAGFALLTLSGIGRAAGGVEQSQASRYVYIVIALMVPVLSVLLDTALAHLARPRHVSATLGVGLLALVVLAGISQAFAFRDGRLSAQGGIRDRVVASAQLLRDGATILNPLPDREFHPDISTPLLGTPEILQALPDLTPSAQGRLDAAANLQVTVTPAVLALPPPVSLHVDGALEAASPGGGCRSYHGTQQGMTLSMLTAAGGAEVRVTSPATSVITHLVRDGLVSDTVPWTTTPGQPQTVATSASDVTLVATFEPAGDLTVCP
ncbi:MAG: hypothetical protein ACOYBY_00025 [Dermatophilaceae bacterium]